MDPDSPGPQAQEALDTLQRFLSDAIPPLQALDSVQLLMAQPPAVAAAGIGEWAKSCYRGQGADFLISDLLFLAMKRLRVFGELQLVPSEGLRGFLQSMTPAVLGRCPPDERALLETNLALLGEEEELPAAVAEASPPAFERSAGHVRQVIERVAGPNRSLSLLLGRVGRISGTRRAAAADSLSPDVPQLVGATVRNARSSEELKLAEQVLEMLGLPVRADSLFRTLAEHLPGWNLPSSAEPDSSPGLPAANSMLEAMRRLIRLADGGRESTRRWQELVRSAVAQIGQGSLQRASAMIGLAESLLSEQPVDASALAQSRSVSQHGLDIEALRPFVENTRNHPHLRRVMAFFDEFSPGTLLEQLAVETNRTRRRLLLNLLEALGESARGPAVLLLEQALAAGDYRARWYVPRNMVYLLHRIRPAGGLPGKSEFATVQRLLDPAEPPPLVKEAVAYFAQFKSEESEKVLASFLTTLERLLTGQAAHGRPTGAAIALLDRTAAALAHQGTPTAVRIVRVHGLREESRLGQTAARLASLSTQDLSCDPESVTRIVEAAHHALPRRMIGVKIGRGSGDLLHLVTALSSTPASEVQGLMRAVVERVPEHESAQVAGKYLRQLDEGAHTAGPGTRRLMGDLDLFGLSDLLQQLERTEASGVLTLSDHGGNTTGTVELEEGKVLACRSGRLSGEEALYQMFEKPSAGTFVFQWQRTRETDAVGPARVPWETGQLIMEGARRYDEYQWLRAVAPDGAALSTAGRLPDFGSEAEDPEFSRSVWDRVAAGATPDECEALVATEPLRIRRLLSRWLEEGVLAEAQAVAAPPGD